jgi:hypothetical protein
MSKTRIKDKTLWTLRIVLMALLLVLAALLIMLSIRSSVRKNAVKNINKNVVDASFQRTTSGATTFYVGSGLFLNTPS